MYVTNLDGEFLKDWRPPRYYRLERVLRNRNKFDEDGFYMTTGLTPECRQETLYSKIKIYLVILCYLMDCSFVKRKDKKNPRSPMYYPYKSNYVYTENLKILWKINTKSYCCCFSSFILQMDLKSL